MRVLLALLSLLFLGVVGHAEDTFTASIVLRNHRFEPAEIDVPAGQRILLHLKNEDPMSEEFDSTALKVEKVFAGNSEGVIRISPLNPGRYDFMGEYHSDTAKGVVVAK